MTDEEAVQEVGWVARRARELAGGHGTRAEWREFYTRKIALLHHIGTPEALEQIEHNEAHLAAWAE